MSDVTTPAQPFPIPVLPEEQSRYFNGFAIAIGAGDVVMTLMRNGVPTITLNASYSVTKTFAASLMSQIEVLEKAANHKIMRVEEVKLSLEAYANHPKS